MQEQQQQVQQAQAEAAAARSKAADAGRAVAQAQHELHQLHDTHRFHFVCTVLLPTFWQKQWCLCVASGHHLHLPTWHADSVCAWHEAGMGRIKCKQEGTCKTMTGTVACSAMKTLLVSQTWLTPRVLLSTVKESYHC